MSETHQVVTDLDPAQARQLMSDGALVVDVREPHEWAAGRIDGAVHHPLSALDPVLLAAQQRPVLAVCRSGGRSSRAAQVLAAQGGPAVYNLAGGMQAWARAGLPMVADGETPEVA
ncbi:rhodanese-like domain-containing protein [Nocardioides acrostichi]|uniref:Rhodanese-like domain-containing protein n=1 Tax=Nocardioides acrostichi TaxID=2784339 RepID=A0A930Y6G8_9ACTN|nr:rhodanese-like domain-containing protein [Nocardioides acrostichi]MBF4160926.1 rhodanese-like domain-containing protein [Nocardioides acrostichi]